MFYKILILPSLQVDLQETPSNNKLSSQTIFPFSGATSASHNAVNIFLLKQTTVCYVKMVLIKSLKSDKVF